MPECSVVLRRTDSKVPTHTKPNCVGLPRASSRWSFADASRPRRHVRVQVVLAQGGNISCYSKAGFGCGRNVRCTRLGCLFAPRSRIPPLRRQERQPKFKKSARALALVVPRAGFAPGSCACALRAKQTPTQHTHGLVENAPSG